MKRYFNTKENAEAHLEYRRECAYTRIEKNNDKILSDASFVYKNKKGKWVVFMQIVTESMLNDLENIRSTRNKTKPLIPFTPAEKSLRREKRFKKIEKKYKTLDIEKYTINKEL